MSKFQNFSDEDILGAVFQKLPMGRKDAGFGVKLMNLNMGR